MSKILTYIFALISLASCSVLQVPSGSEVQLVKEAGKLFAERYLEKVFEIDLDFENGFALSKDCPNGKLIKVFGAKTASKLFTPKGQVLGENESFYFKVSWQPIDENNTRINVVHRKKSEVSMQVIKDFMQNIFARLESEVLSASFIDNYRGQDETDNDLMLFDKAIYISLQPLTFVDDNGVQKASEANMLVHIVQNIYEDAHQSGGQRTEFLNARHDFAQIVYAALQNYSGDFFSPLKRVGYAHDSSPNNFVRDVITFATDITDNSVNVNDIYTKIEPDIEPRRYAI